MCVLFLNIHQMMQASVDFRLHNVVEVQMTVDSVIISFMAVPDYVSCFQALAITGQYSDWLLARFHGVFHGID